MSYSGLIHTKQELQDKASCIVKNEDFIGKGFRISVGVRQGSLLPAELWILRAPEE